MTTVFAVLMGLAIAYFTLFACSLLSQDSRLFGKVGEDGEETLAIAHLNPWAYVGAGLAGVIMGLIAGFAAAETLATGWAIVFLIVLLAAVADLTVANFTQVGNWKEWWVFVALYILLQFPLWEVLAHFSANTQYLVSTIVSLAFGSWLVRLLFFRSEMNKEERPGRAKFQKVMAWVLAILMIAGLATDVVLGIVKNPNRVREETPVDTPADEPEDSPEDTSADQQEEPAKVVYWYQLNANNEKTEPGNFGPDPELDWDVTTGEDVWNLLKDVIFGTGIPGDKYEKGDPNVGVSLAYYNDSATGKRLLRYDDPDDTVNIQNEVLRFIGEAPGFEANKEQGYIEYEAFMTKVIKSIEQYKPEFKIFTTAEARALGIEIKDQLYADYIREEITDVNDGSRFDPKLPVVWTSEMAPEDHFLRSRHYIKGRLVELWFHVECLGQPCNTEEHGMNVEVKANPIKPSSSTAGGTGGKTTTGGGGTTKTTTGGGTTRTTTGGGTTRTTTGGGTGGGGGYVPPTPPTPPTPPITDPKDPTHGIDSGGNKTSGSGGDTNNGVGAKTSTEDTATGTGPSHITDEGLQKWEDELADVVSEQRTSTNTPENKPTDSRPNTDATDSNANKGNGDVGGINTPTPADDVATTGGETLKNSGSSANDAGAWTPGAANSKSDANTDNITVFPAASTQSLPDNPPQASSFGGLDFGGNK